MTFEASSKRSETVRAMIFKLIAALIILGSVACAPLDPGPGPIEPAPTKQPSQPLCEDARVVTPTHVAFIEPLNEAAVWWGEYFGCVPMSIDPVNLNLPPPDIEEFDGINQVSFGDITDTDFDYYAFAYYSPIETDILVDPDDWELHDQVGIVAHELGHMFLFDDNEPGAPPIMQYVNWEGEPEWSNVFDYTERR